MKINKLLVVLVYVLFVSVLLTGCAGVKATIEAAVNTSTNSAQNSSANDVNDQAGNLPVDEKLTAQAQAEGVTVQEMQAALDGLSEIDAAKYGITVEEYIASIELGGSTVLEKWQIAAAQMDASITELYEYENLFSAGLSDEENEILAGMAGALQEVEGMDISGMDESDIEEMLGIYENDSGEIVEVNGNFKDDFYFGAENIEHEYDDEYSIVVEYSTSYDISVISDYYITLLEKTSDYLLLKPIGVKEAMIQGTYNNTLVYVEILEIENGTYVTSYIDLSAEKES